MIGCTTTVKRLQSVDIVDLWEEAVASLSTKSQRGSRGSRCRREMKPEALQASNVRCAKLATQAGQYRRASRP